MKRTRVKCANCGMVYDIIVSQPTNISYENDSGICPKCKSNAYNKIPDYTPRYFGMN